jgi:hypothetical protein
MTTRNGWLNGFRWIASAAFGLCVLQTLAFGQGEEYSASNAASERTSGGVFQRFFGPRENSSTTSKEPSSSPPRSRALKPGAFNGGMVKQLRAIVTNDSDSEAPSSAERNAPPAPLMNSPSTPNRTAQRPPSREPFSKPTMPRSTAPSQLPSASNSNANRRDVFAEDPPSLVGTGVPARRPSDLKPATGGITSYDPPTVTKNPKLNSTNVSGADNFAVEKSRDSNTVSTRSSTKSEASTEVEAPKVTRKTVPVADSNYSSQPSSTTFSPSSTQASRTSTGNSSNAYEPPPISIGSSNGSVSNQSSASKNAPVAKTAQLPPSYSIPGNPYTAPVAKGSAPSNANTTGAANGYANASKVTAPNQSSIDGRGKGETRVEMGIPKVRLFVSGPNALQVGKAVPYEVLVRNEGNEVLSGVLVSMIVPPFVKSSLPVATSGEFESEKDDKGFETLLWHVSDLSPTQPKVFRVSLEATRAEHFTMDVEWTVMPQAGQVKVAVQQPQLNLGLEGPSEVLWGKPEVYRLRVRNPGNADVKDAEVRLTAEAYGSNQSKIGDIPAGGERVVEVELTFQQSGTIKLSGLATSVAQSLESESTIEVAVKQVELSSNWEGLPEQYQGSVAEHRLTVSNQSPVAAENVTGVTSIPAGFKVISLPAGASMNGSEVRWALPRIEANSMVSFDFGLQAISEGPAKLACDITSLGGGKSLAETTIAIEAISDLKLTVTDPVAPAPVGHDVAYDLTIANRGSKAANAVQILAQFSNGIEPVRAEGGTSQVLPGQVVFDPIPVIEAGQEITLRVVAKASEPGMHRFRAEVHCESSEAQLIEEESTRYLATTKTTVDPSTIRR